MSLKPFAKQLNRDFSKVATEIFSQWGPLVSRFNEVDVLLWIGDGSEILEYQGRDDQPLEWAKYIGRANESESDWNKKTDPNRLSPHATRYQYAKSPLSFNFGDIRQIIRCLKTTGEKLTGCRIRVGATFDPGPEFSVSKFKYQWHPEISTGGAMGDKSFVVSYEHLHADNREYATFPHGISEGTHFATFLGRQSQQYLTDMEFDYIWFSNGFGFGAENWSTLGPLFDGDKFDEDVNRVEQLTSKTLEFWHDFRSECPDFEVQTRGTNLSVGIDFATDAVATEELYQGQLGLVPPPNSPWAALDKNYGLELAGYLSRIAELPNSEGYMYRYYLHDPWWANSPWFDRYEQFPHDIYLPLAMSRINHQGKIETAKFANFMTVDNSWGDLPAKGAAATQMHMLNALDDLPNQVAPVTWIYPFHEYQNVTDNRYLLSKAFAEDWYMVAAINAGTPVSTVMSTTAFNEMTDSQRQVLNGTVIVTPVPYAGSEFERQILSFIKDGAKVVFYGSLDNAGADFEQQLGIIGSQNPATGDFKLVNDLAADFSGEPVVDHIWHNSVLADGFGFAKILPGIHPLATVSTAGGEYASTLQTKEPNVYWVRGSNPHKLATGQYLLQPNEPAMYFDTGNQLRYVLGRFGLHIEYRRKNAHIQTPALAVSRSNNAFYFSIYAPNTAVETAISFPLGVPILMGTEVPIEDGRGIYQFDRAEHRECRLFVQQKGGIVSMTEYGPVSVIMKRRMEIRGLDDATVFIFPEQGKTNKCELLLNSEKPNVTGQKFDYEVTHTELGDCLTATHVTGKLMCSFEFDEVNYLENGGHFNANNCVDPN